MYQFLLYLHIIAGSLACIAASGALWVAKGKNAHMRWGLTYVGAMCVVVLTSFAMSYVRPNLFLAFVGLFTAFLLVSGYARAKNRSGKSSAAEWSLAFAGVVIGLAMITVALYAPFKLWFALMAFGLITLLLALRDAYSLKQQRYIGAPRIAAHLTYMLGGTIANVTAVLVVNWQAAPPIPVWLPWLLPTFVLVPYIIYWNVNVLRNPKTKTAS